MPGVNGCWRPAKTFVSCLTAC